MDLIGTHWTDGNKVLLVLSDDNGACWVKDINGWEASVLISKTFLTLKHQQVTEPVARIVIRKTNTEKRLAKTIKELRRGLLVCAIAGALSAAMFLLHFIYCSF